MPKLLDSFYKNKKVLITGHTGFKGSWLSLWLDKQGANVIGFALEPPTKPNLFDILQLKSKIISIFGDVRNFTLLKKVALQHKPEIVFHLAAQSLVRESYKNPLKTYNSVISKN